MDLNNLSLHDILLASNTDFIHALACGYSGNISV